MLSGSKVLVVGMARSGMAAVELLLEKGARIHATDSQPVPEVIQKLEGLGVGFDIQSPAVFSGRDLIVISPGVPADLPELDEARSSGTRVIGELELAAQYLEGPIIGITGANGKTTTTALTGHILEACGIPVQVGGNIGRPPASMVASSNPDQWNVLELSSFQLETIFRFRAHIAVCLNVTPDHLDRHHTFEIYAAAKARLFETQQSTDFAVLNADDATCVSYAAKTPGKVVWFSSTQAGDSLVLDRNPVMKLADIPLRGRHNVENVMAAAAAARLAAAPLDGIADAVRSFPGVEHRLEFVRSLNGVAYYNDSKATNVDATLKAIDAFPGGLWIILGGKDKGSDYTPLREPLREKAHAALLIGAAANKIAGQLEGAVPIEQSGTLDAAIRFANGKAQAGDTVVLAPACASFDQFQNFEHRGNVFKEIVRGM